MRQIKHIYRCRCVYVRLSPADRKANRVHSIIMFVCKTPFLSPTLLFPSLSYPR